MRAAGAGAYLLRWSATMVGVHFVVLCDPDGGVRHVKIERAAEEAAKGRRAVCVQLPTPKERRREGSERREMRVCESVWEAVEAMREPYRLRAAVGPSVYYTALAACKP